MADIDEFENGRKAEDLRMAQEMYSKFCVSLTDNPGQAKTQLIAGIQIALAAARRDGYGVGVWASKQQTSNGNTSGD